MRKYDRLFQPLALLLALVLALSPLTLAAADDGEELFPGFYAQNPFEYPTTCTWADIGAQKNAGLPVYSAPFPEAFRAAKGKAVLGTGSSFTLLGTLQGGTWAMVEYDIDRTRSRVGWIELPRQAPQRSTHYDLDLNRRPAVMKANSALTDDPRRSASALTVLQAGQEVIAMFVCPMGDLTWVYVEAEAEGRVCWGFVLAQAISIRPQSVLYRVEDRRLIIAEGVTSLGYSSSDGDNSSVEIRPGDLHLSSVDLMNTREVREIVFPDSLRELGGEAILTGNLTRLRLDGHLTRVSPWFTYGTDVEEMVLASDYGLDIPLGEYSTVARWTVEPGNPRYASRDGVLFSADGKTLLRYPDGRKDTHYDVPGGTEEIAQRAFDSSDSLPLKTISLPIGLKRVGANAFSGCGRLVSLTVPLTVTELDPSAFEDCVSLERLSLPPGLRAEFDSDWAEQGDFTYFNGDNGSTLRGKQPAQESGTPPDRFESYAAYLDNPEGAGDVPVYLTADTDTVAALRRAGDTTRVLQVLGERAQVYTYDWSDWDEDMPVYVWVPLANLRTDFGEVLFTITGAVPIDREVWFPRGVSSGFWYSTSQGVEFSVPDENGEVYDDNTVTVPYPALTLYRSGPDDGRRLGLILSYTTSTPFLDAPGGQPVGHVFPLTQAMVLEENGEWLRVRTADLEGWIPADCFIPVLPDNNPQGL